MSWFEKLAEAMYEVYDDDFALYVSGAIYTIIVLIPLLIIIMNIDQKQIFKFESRCMNGSFN